MIRVGIADDHAVVRAGLRRLLMREPDLQVTGEAADGTQALALACSGEIDLLLMDLAMPGQGGVDALVALRSRCPTLPVLVLSGFPARDYAPLMQRHGAQGYLPKSAAPAQVFGAIRAVMQGTAWVAPTAPASAGDDAPHLGLSARELQVLLGLAQGRSVGEIAEGLQVSVRSVASWRRQVLTRLQLDTNSDLTYYALKNGLIL